jgi:hypothetical protein
MVPIGYNITSRDKQPGKRGKREIFNWIKKEKRDGKERKRVG